MERATLTRPNALELPWGIEPRDLRITRAIECCCDLRKCTLD